MKVKSLLGWKEVPHGGTSYVTDANDVVDVPDALGASLLEQVDAWAPVKPAKAADSEEK